MWGTPLLSGMTGSSHMVYSLYLLLVQGWATYRVSLPPTLGVGPCTSQLVQGYPPYTGRGGPRVPTRQGWWLPQESTGVARVRATYGYSPSTRRLKCRYQSRITGHDLVYKSYAIYVLHSMHPSHDQHITESRDSPSTRHRPTSWWSGRPVFRLVDCWHYGCRRLQELVDTATATAPHYQTSI